MYVAETVNAYNPRRGYSIDPENGAPLTWAGVEAIGPPGWGISPKPGDKIPPSPLKQEMAS
jgi:hypothetical protein